MNKKGEFVVVHIALTDVFILFSVSLFAYWDLHLGVKEIPKKEVAAFTPETGRNLLISKETYI